MRHYTSGRKISLNNKYFVFGYQYREKKQLSLFNITTGEKLWDIPVDVRPDEVAISNNGKWIVGVGRLEPHWDKYKIILLDNTGKKYHEEIKEIFLGESGGTLLLGDINDDGTEFEVKERISKYNKAKDVYDRKISKKYIYKNIKGKVELRKVIEVKPIDSEKKQ